MKIAFFWLGFNGRYGKWNDGLAAAMRLIEQEHTVRYFDINEGTISECITFQPDVVLYWEAPCTILGRDAATYKSIQQLPFKKILLFAGGQIRKEWVTGFDKLLVESAINEKECADLGIPYARAFGVNESAFSPVFTSISPKTAPKTKGKKKKVPSTEEPETTPQIAKLYDGVMHATFADWKRHTLFAEALGDRGLVIGRKQEHDLNGYNACVERGVHILGEIAQEDLPTYFAQAWSVVNTAEYWGGGQRCTLEAMACNIPPIVMADSPKNAEFVLDSGYGLVVEPNTPSIQRAIEEIKTWSPERIAEGRKYILSKWTARHYADAILANI